jgi:glycosyltransferase involved in cell wall biosynthesis
MISFIVPAHNEDRWIGGCLASIRKAAESLGQPYEVLVVDDASTDATAEIAQRHAARVIRIDDRQISKSRDAGARAAQGELFFFIDADTLANEMAVSAAVEAMRAGAVGGGCIPEFDRHLPLAARIVYHVCIGVARWGRWVGGCFLFCTREAYDATGGFSTQLYAGEDIAFIQALKRVGSVSIPKPTVVTSGRKLDVVGVWEIIYLVLAVVIRGPYHRSRKGLDIFYGERAEACRQR